MGTTKMKMIRDRWRLLAAVLAAIVVLPLCGVLAAGHSIEPYLEFPPRTRFVVHQSFSWPVFLVLALCIVTAVVPFLLRVSQAHVMGDASRVLPPASRAFYDQSCFTFHEPRRFPWWGWVGLIWTGLAWGVAWNRWDWLGEWQLHTFTPLWLGYIAVVNAFTAGRTGSNMMLRRPRAFLLLFPLSAVFWWTFEYLNRFVQNWYYLGPREFTAIEYVLLATIPFSTVLPAVISTVEWLSTYPQLSAGLERAWPMPIVASRQAGWSIIVGAAGGLVGIGLWPEYLFPLVWVAPLLLITGLQLASGGETVFDAAARGDWRLLWVAALASLICGFFWELWNSRSLVHWEYAVPFAHRFQLFEMPLLGYAGYLPFGLECLAVAQLFMPPNWLSLQVESNRKVTRREHQPDVSETVLKSPPVSRQETGCRDLGS